MNSLDNGLELEIDSFVSKVRESNLVLDDATKEKFKNALTKRLTSKMEITAFLDTLKTIDNVDGIVCDTVSESRYIFGTNVCVQHCVRRPASLFSLFSRSEWRHFPICREK